ncbi:MAG: hypothetical protein ACXW3Y_13990 [Rhodoplanes sp.]
MLNVATQPTYKSLIGVGIYTVPEASRYTGVAAGKIKRWLKGYDYVQRGERRQAAPLWNPQIELDDGELHLGFRDLVELRVVNAFIEEGFSPWRVRQGLIAARTLAGVPSPRCVFRPTGVRSFSRSPRRRAIRTSSIFFRVSSPSVAFLRHVCATSSSTVTCRSVGGLAVRSRAL